MIFFIDVLLYFRVIYQMSVQILICRTVKADFKAFPSGEGGPLAVDEEIAKQQANRFQNHHFNKILFATPVAKSTSICQRHISYCEAVYHSSFIISFSRKRPSHLAAFSLRQNGHGSLLRNLLKKLQKERPISWGAAPNPVRFLKKAAQKL